MLQRIATSSVIGRTITDKYIDPKVVYTPRDIISDMKKVHGLDISYRKAHRAKIKALEIVRGDPADSYAKLPSYLYMLKHSNPGSFVSLSKTDEGNFLYAFAALNSSIKGWEYCRPVVVVDGTFLKASYRGTFLTASCQDAGGNILPLAYAIVDSENNASWEWFFRRFKEAYRVREKMCFVSDRHQSIIREISVVYPGLPHCACMWHLWGNIADNYKKHHLQLEPIYYAMARPYIVQDFDHYMAEVERIDNREKNYLFDIGYHRWSRAHSTVNRTMTMTSNIAESINSATKNARDLPVARLFEEMRILVEKWNYDNMKEALYTATTLSGKYEQILAENISVAQHMTVRASSDTLHSVTYMGRTFVVCIRERKCTCRRFQLDEVPCPHALAVLISKGLEGNDYNSLYYTKEYMLKTYEIPVNPIPDPSMWEIPLEVLEEIVLPPVGNKVPGRPKRKRLEKAWEKHEKKYKSTCRQCGMEGHNRRTCRKKKKKIHFIACFEYVYVVPFYLV
ncbi:protein FAR1-RELATED SEQUENCE 5-like [Lycium barbarum]|uniref:protein FAR1-RELATED SEQUENCE 5-like n=1 Tax=Lycium barbarum TaxID=112863 RepID=UPI00293E4FE4|nr:protein FAR1-RELATED SEQUENCE 5-like [Lycium barbarum]